MRVAVPSFRGHVSPVFDWAQCIVMVDYDGGRETARREESLAEVAPPFRPGFLARVGVGTLVCGGISRPLAEMVQMRGIRVMAGVAGEIGAVLAAFFAGRLPALEFTMPGWGFLPPPCGPGMRRRRRFRGGPGRWRRE